MALATGESFSRGLVVTAAGLSVTTSTVGATWKDGFKRDADGRLVVTFV